MQCMVSFAMGCCQSPAVYCLQSASSQTGRKSEKNQQGDFQLCENSRLPPVFPLLLQTIIAPALRNVFRQVVETVLQVVLLHQH